MKLDNKKVHNNVVLMNSDQPARSLKNLLDQVILHWAFKVTLNNLFVDELQ